MKLAPGWLELRLILPAALAALVLVAAHAPAARADEQRAARLGLAVSAMVTSLNPDDLNDAIGDVNRFAEEFGLNTIGDIQAAAFFQAEGRFFVSDRIVAVAGFGRIKRTSELSLLPQLGSEILLQGAILGVPRHVGLDYYFTPYTSGDVTLRPFVGGGLMDVVEARMKVGGRFTVDEAVFDAFARGRGEGVGFYVESGVHLMLPGRYSFIGNVHYRNLKVDHVRFEDAQGRVDGVLVGEDGQPVEIDFSGFGLRLALNLDILDRL